MTIRTEAQREQARINGRKSRGPVTPEGKEASSRNSLKHGMRSKKLLTDEDRLVYRARRDAYVAAEKEPPEPRRLTLLEALALASVQVEIACSARNAAGRLQIKALLDADRIALADCFEAAVAGYRTNPSYEAFQELSRTPAGCHFVASEWGMIIRDAEQLPDDRPIPVDLHDRIVRLTLSIADLDLRQQTIDFLDQWSELPRIPKPLILILCGESVDYWNELAAETDRDLLNDRELRLTVAKVDLTTNGERLHRYMQSSLNTMIRINKQLDAEYDREWKRRWKEEAEGIEPFPARDEDEGELPNEPDESELTETEELEATQPAPTEASATPTQPNAPTTEPTPARRPTASLPNEPGASDRPLVSRAASRPGADRGQLPNEPNTPQSRQPTPVTAIRPST